MRAIASWSKRASRDANRVDLNVELVVGDRSVHVRVLLRPRSVEVVGDEEDLERTVAADQAREPGRRSAAGDHTDADLELAEDRRLARREAHVSRRHELAPGAAGASADRGDADHRRAGHAHAFTARRVRAMASNRDYMGDGPYPAIIDPVLFERVNDKIRRVDAAAVQNARGGRRPKADFMLRRLCWCAECGQPVYAIVHHGKRLYRCKASLQYTGTCSSLPIPADLAEQRILDHLELFVGHVETWIGERLAERSDEQQVLQTAVDARRRELASLDAQRERRMAELTTIGITSVGLEVIERIDSERTVLAEAIADAEARLTEWTATPTADAALDFYNRIVDVVAGRVAQADGIAEINAVLHDTLLGVSLGFDGETLMADIQVRPSGLDDYDVAVAELFGTFPTRQETTEMLERLLPDEADEATISRPRT